MNRSQGPAASFAMFAGAFYLIDGIWGFFSPITFGVLSTNTLHTVIHLLMGLAGIYAARNYGARLWCRLIGVVVLAVGIAYFLPAGNTLVVSLFNLNQAVAVLNIVAGVLTLAFSRMRAPAI